MSSNPFLLHRRVPYSTGTPMQLTPGVRVTATNLNACAPPRPCYAPSTEAVSTGKRPTACDAETMLDLACRAQDLAF